jgi:hypothetical protein
LTSRALALLAAAALAGCGGSDSPPADAGSPATRATPPPDATASPSPEPAAGAPTSAEVATIRDWADTLRKGRVEAASRYFALPTVVANPVPLRLRSRAAVEAFNAGLPCGAKLLDTRRGTVGDVVATFRLTERPGPGSCGQGTGALAQTSFVIRDGLIVRWLRIDDPPPPDTQES